MRVVNRGTPQSRLSTGQIKITLSPNRMVQYGRYLCDVQSKPFCHVKKWRGYSRVRKKLLNATSVFFLCFLKRQRDHDLTARAWGGHIVPFRK